MSDFEVCRCGAPGPRPTPCTQCGKHVLFSVREGFAHPRPTDKGHVWRLEPFRRPSSGEERTFATCARCDWTMLPESTDGAPPCPGHFDVIHSIAVGNGREGASTCAKCGCWFYSADDDDSCAECSGKVVRCECGALRIAGHTCVCAAIPELERDDAGSAESIRGQAARHERELERVIERVERQTFPPTFELELDPFERIEHAAAAWRNAYRALERRDAPAVERHLREAVDHNIELVRGLK